MSGFYRRSARKTGGYTVIPNALLCDSSLSFETRGLLGYLLSKPDGWEGRAADIEAEGGIGYEKRRRITIEAEEAGYMAYRRLRAADGTLNQYYEVFDTPLPADERTSSKSFGKKADQPTPAKPSAAEPSAAQPGSYKVLNEQLLNNKELINGVDLKTAEELQAASGEVPTAEDVQTAQEILFLRTGKTYCVHKYPEMLAWVQNCKRVYKADGVTKLLDAHRKPEAHGISCSWPRWKIDHVLFELKTPTRNTQILANRTLMTQEAVATAKLLKAQGLIKEKVNDVLTEKYGWEIAAIAMKPWIG